MVKVRADGLTRMRRTRDGRRAPALEACSLRVPPTLFLCVVGPPGSGKSTLLRILAGLEQPDRGTVGIRREDPSRPLVSMAFQGGALFPWLTVGENIAYGLRLRGWLPEHQRDAAAHYARQLGLSRYLDLPAEGLPEAVQQRASVARAWANDPEVLLLDEPLAAQDPEGASLLAEALLGIRQSRRHTVICTLRTEADGTKVADRWLFLKPRGPRGRQTV